MGADIGRDLEKSSKTLHVSADFWHKQKDQAIGGTIFLCLTVLSFLPLTWLQTSTLYNAKFAANLRWRARREMFLDNLMA